MLSALDWAVVALALCLQLARLARITHHAYRRAQFDQPTPTSLDDMFANPMLLPISLVVLVRSLREPLVEEIRALLGARYPQLEVVAVVSPRAPEALAVLSEAFGARGEGKVRSAVAGSLTLVAAQEADPVAAVGAALEAVHYPLVFLLEDSWLPEDDTLLRMARALVDGEEATGVAVAGVEAGSERRYRDRIREALRAQADGAPGGAGLYKRSDLAAVSGRPGTSEGGWPGLARQVSSWRREQGLGSAIVRVPRARVRCSGPSPAVPGTGGRPGLAAWSSLVELGGWVVLICSVLFGGAGLAWLALYALVTLGLGSVVSATATLVAEHPRLAVSAAAAVADNLGYRQVRGLAGLLGVHR